MAATNIQDELATCFSELDEQMISPPIEITIGDYSFYPYRGFSDILRRDDYRKLSQQQLKSLLKIGTDILHMRKRELFEAFVNDDGVIVVDKYQEQIEYSIDVEYNDARHKIEEIYPQVAYPQAPKAKPTSDDDFVRNDTAHEVGHHADFWLDVDSHDKHLQYMHSSSTLLAWLEQLDSTLHPGGVADLIVQVRTEEGYVAEALLEEGYKPQKVDSMLRAEFFAIACEFFFGSEQHFEEKSPLLEVYMNQVLETDLDIQNQFITFKEMEQRRAVLYQAIHQPVKAILGHDAKRFQNLRDTLDTLHGRKERVECVSEIEGLVVGRISDIIAEVRDRVKLSPL